MTTPSNTPPHNTSDDGYTGMPRWVKLLLLAIFVITVIVIFVVYSVGGDHGPGRHMSAPSPDTATVPSTGRG